MFEIEVIDPKFYRRQTRRATWIIIGLFLVVGMLTATLFVQWLGPYSNSPMVVNFMGAFAGLVLTGLIVKWFFKDRPWMKEAMYGWRLKRSLMQIGNRLRPLQHAAAQHDVQAMNILRFYHLGLEQMHRLEDNSTALIDLLADKRKLETQMTSLGLELDQLRFDPKWLEPYPNKPVE